ncbi:MAG: hypothetical protein HY908_16215 [Myxococcales bacterium]|nr:hypothetical protein [Myxococcales bacterium]
MFRQDLPRDRPHAPPPGAAQAPKPAAAKQAPAHDKITLILHPPPKAAVPKRAEAQKPLTAKEALKARAARFAQVAKASAAEARPAAGPKTLDPSWVEADAASAAESLEAAAAVGATDALVKAWLDGNNTEAIAAAAATERMASPLRKAARRALGVLRARGAAIPEIAPDVLETRAGVEAASATFVPADATGTVFYSFTQREPSGRFRVADVLVREGVGVVHASSGRIAGKHIRKWRERVQDRFGTAPVEVPLEWARQRVAEARDLNTRSGQIVPLTFDGCLPLVEPPPTSIPPHPVAELESQIDSDAVQAAVMGSDALHNEPEFSRWRLDRPALDAMVGEIAKRLGDKGEPDQARFDGILAEEIAAATDRFFTPDVRTALAQRLTDSAISVRRRQGEAAARRVVALARAVREAGLITAPPRDVPFLATFFHKGFAMLVHESQGRLRVPASVAQSGLAPMRAPEPAGDAPVEALPEPGTPAPDK